MISIAVSGFSRRLAEPLALGTVANVFVNVLFNPHAMQWHWDEFLVAWLLSLPITELNRYIDLRLENAVGWAQQPRKRFVYHFLLLACSLVILLNVLGNAYLWMAGKGYFTMYEYLIVNFVTMGFAFLLATLRWAVHFYRHWIKAETTAEQLAQSIDRLSMDLALQRGRATVKVPIRQIRMARIEQGVVRVFTGPDDWFVFPGSLASLAEDLPVHMFFPVTRDLILHRDMIRSISSGSFGKVHLTVDDVQGPVVVSRPRAAAFRRWYHSNSVEKP